VPAGAEGEKGEARRPGRRPGEAQPGRRNTALPCGLESVDGQRALPCRWIHSPLQGVVQAVFHLEGNTASDSTSGHAASTLHPGHDNKVSAMDLPAY